MAKNVVIQGAPTLAAANLNNPEFFQDKFDQLIWEKGYPVIHETCLMCPCKSKTVNQLSDCKNCGGTTYIFVNPVLTRMSLRNMNESTQYKAWSIENLGNVGISHLNRNKLMYMDRITLTESKANFNEVRHFKKTDDDIIFTYLSYHAKSIIFAGLFVDGNTKLTKLVKDEDYTFDGNKFFLTDKYVADYDNEIPYSITISYEHHPQYHIIDLPRQVMQSRTKTNGVEKVIDLPLHAMGRRAHFVLDTQNIASNRLLDNSYNDLSCGEIIKTVDSYSKMC